MSVRQPANAPKLHELQALDLARQQLQGLNPQEIARRAGARYVTLPSGERCIEMDCLGRPLRITYPAGEVLDIQRATPARPAHSLLALHYLLHADGQPVAGHWVAFRELPDGFLYAQAFCGRTEPHLAAAFGNDLERFYKASQAIGGKPIAFGDAAFMFQALPRVNLAVVLHLGDDEFPPAVSILFDGAAGHYLATDDLAVLGGMLVGMLLRAAN